METTVHPTSSAAVAAITNGACYSVHCMFSVGPCLFFCHFPPCPMAQSPLGEGDWPFEMISTVFLHQGTAIEVFHCLSLASANLRVGTEWEWPCNLLRGHLMKQNVFIYFPGCISSCNMFLLWSPRLQVHVWSCFQSSLCHWSYFCAQNLDFTGLQDLFILGISTYSPWDPFF